MFTNDSKSRQKSKYIDRSKTNEMPRKLIPRNRPGRNNVKKSIDLSQMNSQMNSHMKEFNDTKNISSINHENLTEFQLFNTRTAKDTKTLLENTTDLEANCYNNNTFRNLNEDDQEDKNIDEDVFNEDPDVLNFNNTNDEIKHKFNKIFNNFAVYSKEEKVFFLSFQNLIKILKLINILDTKALKYVDLDILLKKICSNTKKNLNEQQFSDLMILIIKKIDPKGFKSDPRQTSINVIRSLFNPVLEFIDQKFSSNMNSTKCFNNGTIFVQHSVEAYIDNFILDSKVSSFLSGIHNTLKELYTIYFHYENNNYKNESLILQQGFNNLLNFLKDFEVTPYIITINQLTHYWKLINNLDQIKVRKFPQIFSDNKNIGNRFTLSKFALMLAHFSIITFNKINQNYYPNFSEAEKLLFFLERLENSRGFHNIEKKTSKPHNNKLRLIPNKKLIKLVLPTSALNHNSIIENTSESISFSTSTIFTTNRSIINVNKIKELNENSKKNKSSDLKSFLSVGEGVIKKIESKIETLREIFSNYSKIGDKLNFNKMNITSFLRFLKDCDILYNPSNNFNKEDVNLDFFSVRTNSKSPMKSIFTSSLVLSHNQSVSRNYHSLSKNGKILESDADLIFTILTGNRNFNNKSFYKSHFNKNKGFSMDMTEAQKTAYLDPSTSFSTSKINIPSRMDFNLFLKSFELLAVKLYPNYQLDEAVKHFLENDINKLITEKDNYLSQKREIVEMLGTLKKEQISELIQDIQSFLLTHYENYCDPNGYMNFEQFYKFYKQFSLFPNIMNLIQIKNIFFTLSEIFVSHFQNKNKEMNSRFLGEDCHTLKKELEKQEMIDFELFMDSIALSSKYIKYTEDLEDHERILYLLEKMSKSEGVIQSQKLKGFTYTSLIDFSSVTHFLKQKYPEYYKKKKESTIVSKRDEFTFKDLFQNK